MDLNLIKCGICLNSRPFEHFETCLCTKKTCFCCLEQLSTCAKEINVNALDSLVGEHALPCPFCRRDLSKNSEFATSIMERDNGVRKEKHANLVEINKLKQKVATLQNEVLDLKESVDNEKRQKEENDALYKKTKITKKRLTNIIIDRFELENKQQQQ